MIQEAMTSAEAMFVKITARNILGANKEAKDRLLSATEIVESESGDVEDTKILLHAAFAAMQQVSLIARNLAESALSK